MRIIVVEDDADFALVTTETLRFAGHEVAIATTVDAAQQLVERTIPDLAVIDIVLPDGSGLDLCRWIRERYPDVPLILLSSLNRTADILAGFSTGADDYMTKPFHPSELI